MRLRRTTMGIRMRCPTQETRVDSKGFTPIFRAVGKVPDEKRAGTPADGAAVVGRKIASSW